MKMSFGKRFLFFIHWLLSVAGVTAFLSDRVYPPLGKLINEKIALIPGNLIFPVTVAIAVIYVIISLWVLVILFSRIGKRSDRGFIVTESTDKGRVRIAIAAIEQMVRQAIGTVDGVHDMKISINNREDAVGIDVNAIINTGAHVPTVTTNMQNAIRHFVEMNCGVAVRAVEISVQSVVDGDEKGRKARKGISRTNDRPIPQPVMQQEPEVTPVAPAQSYEPDPIEMKYETEQVAEPSYVETYATESSEEPQSGAEE